MRVNSRTPETPRPKRHTLDARLRRGQLHLEPEGVAVCEQAETDWAPTLVREQVHEVWFVGERRKADGVRRDRREARAH